MARSSTMVRQAVAAMLRLGPLLAVTAAVAAGAAFPLPPSAGGALGPCAVTKPDGNRSPVVNDPDPGGYGNAALWTNLWMWGEGDVAVPADHVRWDGSFGPMKWAWYRHVPGHLTIEGRRLDASAPPLRTDIPPDGYYGDRGFLPVGITFPTEGCWEVTGRVGDASLTFVTLVVPQERR